MMTSKQPSVPAFFVTGARDYSEFIGMEMCHVMQLNLMVSWIRSQSTVNVTTTLNNLIFFTLFALCIWSAQVRRQHIPWQTTFGANPAKSLARGMLLGIRTPFPVLLGKVLVLLAIGVGQLLWLRLRLQGATHERTETDIVLD